MPNRRRRRRRATWTASLALAVAAAAGCDTTPLDRMIHVSPPRDWTESLSRFRESKDQFFRSSPDSPLVVGAAEDFSGLDYFPPNPNYYYVGPINEYVDKQEFSMVTTAGTRRPCQRFGWIEFPIDGISRRLQVYRMMDSGGGVSAGDLLLPFTDATSGETTYPAGRYVNLSGPDGGPFVLDFNHAYNPSCAYGAPERFACPVTPAENRLAIPIEVGERGFRPDPAEGA